MLRIACDLIYFQGVPLLSRNSQPIFFFTEHKAGELDFFLQKIKVYGTLLTFYQDCLITCFSVRVEVMRFVMPQKLIN